MTQQQQYFIDAAVHKQLPNGSYRVKATVLNDEISMTINGMIVFAPSDKKPQWTVYTPKVFNAYILEFAGASPLWIELRKKCIEAVQVDPTFINSERQAEPDPYAHIGDDNFQEEHRKALDALGL